MSVRYKVSKVCSTCGYDIAILAVSPNGTRMKCGACGERVQMVKQKQKKKK